jgi:glycine/D-amino acid oxidase-like deaminating enzyme
MFKCEPDEIVARYGEETGTALLDLVANSAKDVFGLVKRLDLKCDAVHTGWIQAAWGKSGGEVLHRRHAQWSRRSAPVRLLGHDEVRALTGTSFYREGLLHEDGGSVNPLGFVRALAGAARNAGAVIYVNSHVTRLLRRVSDWIASSPSGDVAAKTIVLTTNAYTGNLWPGLRQSIVPLYSMQVASVPLSPELKASILPSQQAVADTRRLVWYYRRDRDGRFILGSRGPFKPRPRDSEGEVLVRAARKLYPSLEGIAFPFTWAGRVAMTTDHMPHLHRLAPGVIAALGYNGRGVAMATTMGRVVAATCVDEMVEHPTFPVTELRRIPFHAFHRAGVQAVTTYFRLLDRLA